ncbi:hypothetical protein Tco_0632860 [Tanacetum coccineum]
MAERTMEELLRAPTEGYGEAIVLPEINADHFEIKTNLLQLVQANPFNGRENENPHAHINSFKRITSTLRFRNVPNDVIKLMMFPYSLEGAAKTCEAWERFKELLRASPLNHGFTELTQVDTFYNGLNENEQDSLNTAVGGNLLSKTTREALNIIENKSKVRYSRNRSNASRMNATSSKTDERIDKLADQLSTLVEIVSKKVVTPAPVKAVEESCVTVECAPLLIPVVDDFANTQSPIPESDIQRVLLANTIPYPSRSVDQKSRDKASESNGEDLTNLHVLRFDICLQLSKFLRILEGYYDSEGDVTYLESLLSEDTTHNLSPEVFFDHEPQQLRNEPENEPLITFSPKSDPLHHEFTGELITIPPVIVREHEGLYQSNVVAMR